MQHKYFLLWFFILMFFIFKIVWVISQTDPTSTSKFLVFILLLSIKYLQLKKFTAKSYIYFISLEFCEPIRENCDELLSFILHGLFYTVILMYSSLHIVFLLSLKVFSCVFNHTYAFCKYKTLNLLLFLTILFTIFNNSPHNIYVNDC